MIFPISVLPHVLSLGKLSWMMLRRHIEPPLAYHLELKRLRDYEVTLVPTDNKQLHLYVHHSLPLLFFQ
jgi:hypothetical protein